MDLTPVRALFFDCYGTLIDWESGIMQALMPLLARNGISADPEEVLGLFAGFETEAEAGPYQPYRKVLGAVLQKMASHYGFSLTDSEENLLADSLPQWPAFFDTRISLQKLASKYKLGILSNVDDDLIARTRKKIAVDFEWVITAEQLQSYKPSPRNFEAILEKTGLETTQILHCAQSVFHDCIPATAAGFSCVWVDRRAGQAGGATPMAALGDQEPWIKKVESLAELAQWLCADQD